MAYTVAVLGVGRVGGAIANFCTSMNMHVTAVDPKMQQLDNVNCKEVLCADPVNHTKVLHDIFDKHDVTICALPGHIGNFIVGQAAEYGAHMVDISYAPEDPIHAWYDTAVKNKARIVVDMGVAPGIANFCIGDAIAELDEVGEAAYYVGGLPKIRKKPFEYKATWSPADIIEEYTRPARFKVYNRIRTIPVFSDVELMDFPGVGTLEAFSTDGLRTLLHTTDIPTLKEKTLRWPGHCDVIKLLDDIGLFSQQVIRAGPYSITPRCLAEELLKDQWKLEEGDGDFTVLKVEAKAAQGRKKIEYFLYVENNQYVSSMALSTGWPAAVAAKMMCQGKFPVGVTPPEWIGTNKELAKQFNAELRNGDIFIKKEVSDG